MSIGMGHGAVNPDPEPEPPQRPARGWKFALTGLVAAFVVLAAYDLTTMSGEFGSNGIASQARPVAASRSPASPSAASAPVPSTASSPAPHSLSVASIAAFGPEGTTDGDNPGIVSRIVDVSTDQPWYSLWYATPEFGNLQSGTGLLLDMGEPVTVSSVQLVLGGHVGAAVQVRVGSTAALPDLSTVAAAMDVGGSVQLPTAVRASGSYVLIWFTALPPNGQGEYQVSVYSVTVDGTAGT